MQNLSVASLAFSPRRDNYGGWPEDEDDEAGRPDPIVQVLTEDEAEDQVGASPTTEPASPEREPKAEFWWLRKKVSTGDEAEDQATTEPAWPDTKAGGFFKTECQKSGKTKVESGSDPILASPEGRSQDGSADVCPLLTSGPVKSNSADASSPSGCEGWVGELHKINESNARCEGETLPAELQMKSRGSEMFQVQQSDTVEAYDDRPGFKAPGRPGSGNSAGEALDSWRFISPSTSFDDRPGFQAPETIQANSPVRVEERLVRRMMARAQIDRLKVTRPAGRRPSSVVSPPDTPVTPVGQKKTPGHSTPPTKMDPTRMLS